jgi:hypothetical protein
MQQHTLPLQSSDFAAEFTVRLTKSPAVAIVDGQTK